MKIIFNKEEKEAQAIDEGKKVGFCQYEEDGSLWKITHTVVDKKYGGQGLAGKLLDQVIAAARKNNKKILPICSYAVMKFDEDEKYKDVDAR